MSIDILSNLTTGERLDKAVTLVYPQYSRSSLARLISDGSIKVNQQRSSAKYKVKQYDQVSIDLSQLDETPQTINIPIIYQDNNVVVINKPVGVLAHSKGNFNPEATVASWLQDNYSDDSDFWKNNRSGIVHRLDRATSGVMICAKNETAQKFLQKQFSMRKVKKTYIAEVCGHLKHSEANIDIPIERNPKKPALFRAGPNGKSAQTFYKVISSTSGNDMVELTPKTGRTHQLRVHMAYLGHPIIGDEFYGKGKSRRLMLHASNLEITLPGGEMNAYSAPLPDKFNSFSL